MAKRIQSVLQEKADRLTKRIHSTQFQQVSRSTNLLLSKSLFI